MATWNRIDWPVEEMREMYEQQGMSCTSLAEAMSQRLGRKVTGKLVWKVCKKNGFEMRPVGSCPGDKNPAWNGGRTLDKSGYVMVWLPTHRMANSSGYVREHRLIAEHSLGRPLADEEVVHHIDGNPQNNDPANLAVYECNADHLADTLKGKCPRWTEDGLAKIAAGVQKRADKYRGKSVATQRKQPEASSIRKASIPCVP